MANAKKQEAERVENISIAAPKIQTIEFKLVGTAPLVINKFGAKGQMMMAQQAGSTSKKGKKKEAKNFEALYEQAMHKSTDGWCGIHAGSFRAALISACRLVGFKMTIAKLSVFVLADGFEDDGTPLIQIHGGKPEMAVHHVRNATGVIDLRARPMWKKWWVNLRVRYDADQFTSIDVANLLLRVGEQVGIGEGRPDSKQSCGMGWGTFTLAQEKAAGAVG
jgi:hypothetical protein